MTQRMFHTTEDMFEQLGFCGYECEGGVLTMNVAYIELKEKVRMMEDALKWYANRDNYSTNTAMNGFDVFTDEGKLAREALE